jgi:D-hexose-6-phosphate mutarotase
VWEMCARPRLRVWAAWFIGMRPTAEKNRAMNLTGWFFPGEVDRIYFETPPTIQLVDENRALSISAEGFRDTVIWNPGSGICAKLADMEPDGYLRFVCVEAAAIARPIVLVPGETWRGAQILSA